MTGRVLLPADLVPLMRPWAATAPERFPDLRFAQNQMHGPIFEYYSWRYAARERLRSGQVPLWNPDELSGNVLLANNQSAVLYPPNLLLYVLPLWSGINLVTLLHTLLTGLFMYGLLRALRLGAPAAAAGASVWMLCGLQQVWTEFQTPTATLCWLPAVLWAWELGMVRERPSAAVLGSGVALALALTAGHLHFGFYVVLAFVAWALARGVVAGLLRRESPPIRRAVPALALLGALALAGLLAGAALLPVVEMGRLNFRAHKASYAASVALRLPPRQLLMLVLPNVFGNPRDYVQVAADGSARAGHAYWGAYDFIEYTAYVGVPAIVLAGVGLWLGWGRGRGAGSAGESEHGGPWGLWPLAAIGAFGLLLALGTPLCALLYYGVPGYRQFNATARALCLVSFAAAGLAAHGIDALARRGGRPAGAAVLAAAGAVAAAAVLGFAGLARAEPVVLSDPWLGYEVGGLVRCAGLVAATGLAAAVATRGGRAAPPACWALAALCTLDLWTWGAGFNPVTDPAMLGYPTQTTDFLRRTPPDRVLSLQDAERGFKSLIVPNYNLVVGYREAQGADSLHSRRYHDLVSAAVRADRERGGPAFADPNTVRVASVASRLFDVLNVRWVTTMPDRPLPPGRFRRAADAELTVWENRAALGPAWVASAVEPVESAADCVARLSAPGFEPSFTALVDARAAERVREGMPAAGQGATGPRAWLTTYSPHRLAYEVSAPGGGLLVTSETMLPGWRASVNGRRAEVVTADWVLRAVPVPAGRSHVVLTYEPSSYRVGLYLSGVGLALAAGALAYRWRRPTPE
ncbi:MAG: YfhO family protein [Chthonomonadales bacterium]|nr:YfhO family protein [Chthonomonadales bacterium]